MISFKHKLIAAGVLGAAALSALMYFHGARFTKCYMSGWVDLDYPLSSIEYNFTTGRCPITQPDGRKVYLEKLLGISGAGAEEAADAEADSE